MPRKKCKKGTLTNRTAVRICESIGETHVRLSAANSLSVSGIVIVLLTLSGCWLLGLLFSWINPILQLWKFAVLAKNSVMQTVSFVNVQIFMILLAMFYIITWHVLKLGHCWLLLTVGGRDSAFQDVVTVGLTNLTQ